MENASPLPEGYSELLKIDLQKDRKSALLVNGLALLIALPMVAVGAVMAPFSTLLDSSAGWHMRAGGAFCWRDWWRICCCTSWYTTYA